jgi:dTDP-4-amino-4,6-dideoxygalactose transaminase
MAGTNLRPTDVHAMFGLQDFKRLERYRQHRRDLQHAWREGLNGQYYLPPPPEHHAAFCLPILSDQVPMKTVKRELNERGIQTRPIIGGHLGYQPAFKAFFEQPIADKYPNAEWIHRHGCYIGAHQGVTTEMVYEVTDLLNSV